MTSNADYQVTCPNCGAKAPLKDGYSCGFENGDWDSVEEYLHFICRACKRPYTSKITYTLTIDSVVCEDYKER